MKLADKQGVFVVPAQFLQLNPLLDLGCNLLKRELSEMAEIPKPPPFEQFKELVVSAALGILSSGFGGALFYILLEMPIGFRIWNSSNSTCGIAALDSDSWLRL